MGDLTDEQVRHYLEGNHACVVAGDGGEDEGLDLLANVVSFLAQLV